MQACILQQASGVELDQLLSPSPTLLDESDVVRGEIPLQSWLSWTTVQLCSEQRPELVVNPLLHAGEFDVLQRWTKLHNVPSHLHKVWPPFLAKDQRATPLAFVSCHRAVVQVRGVFYSVTRYTHKR